MNCSHFCAVSSFAPCRIPTFSRALLMFWVPRLVVERVVYHIESDVENKTSRSRHPDW